MHRPVIRRAVAAAAVVAIGLPLAAVAATPQQSGDGTLALAATWSPFPSGTTSTGGIVADSSTRLGVALSDNSIAPDQLWSRAEYVSLDSGRAVGKPLSIPQFRIQPFYAAHVLDTKHHVLIYATPGISQTSPWRLVGLSTSGPSIRQLFDVASRFTLEGIVGIGIDEANEDLMIAGSADHATTTATLATGSGVDLDRISISGLMHGKLQPRWSSPYSISKTLCPTVIDTRRATGVLVLKDRVYIGCHQANVFGSSLVTQNRTPSGVVRLSGVGPKLAATVSGEMFSAPGNFENYGDSVVDGHDGRLVLLDSVHGIGARVFDAEHDRYVGRVPLGFQILSGIVVDPATGRLYAGSHDSQVGLADSDLSALVPTQGLHEPEPWAVIFQQNQQVLLGFDSRRRTLLVPVDDTSSNKPFQILVIKDGTPPYVQPATPNPDAGALDVPEQPNVTDSQRYASAQAYGADYQLIGGIADLQQNAGTGDSGAAARPGSNFLRQAEVSEATLSNDESTAQATTGREDQVTDGVRQSVPNGGDEFAPSVSCSDFGSSPTTGAKTSYTALVDCNYAHSHTHAASAFVADGGVFITSGSKPPVASPVQVSSSVVDVVESRAAGFGAVTTTVSATAHGVTLPGGVRIGAVSTVLTLVTHGHHGTAKEERTISISDVAIGSTAVCAATCSEKVVEDAISAAVPGRVHVDFPSAQRIASAGGTYAEVVQDPWYHAERVLDAEKADTDVAVPAMTVTVYLDGQTKSRLVVDLAAAAASSSYRIFRLAEDAPFGTAAQPPVTAHQQPLGLMTGVSTSSPVAHAAAPQVATAGFLPTIARAARLLFGSVGRLFALLPVFLLLGIPVYLSARRRLLLELPLLSRDEESS